VIVVAAFCKHVTYYRQSGHANSTHPLLYTKLAVIRKVYTSCCTLADVYRVY